MALGGFLGQLGYQAGQNIIQGVALDTDKTNLELKQQQVAQNKLSLLSQQRTAQTKQQVGQMISSEIQKDQSILTDPQKSIKLYGEAETKFLQNGDFEGAKEMSTMVDQKTKESKDAAALVAQQGALKKEDLANAAQNYATNPTPELAADMTRKAVAAGVNPLTIPPPGTPAFKTWTNEQAMASMTAKERVEFLQKANDTKVRQDEIHQAHQDSLAERDATRQSTAAYQQGMLQLRGAEIADRRERAAAAGGKAPEVKEFTDGMYERDPQQKLPGDRLPGDSSWAKISDSKLTSQQKQGVSRIAFSSSEIQRSLANVVRMPPGTTSSPFGELGADHPLEALTKIGANTLTPAQSQMLSVNSAGLGNQIAGMESALGGRMAAGDQQARLEHATTPSAGDSGYTALYKLANTKEIAKTAIENAPGHYGQTKEGQERIAALDRAVPYSTEQIIDMVAKDPKAKKDAAQVRKMADDMVNVKSKIRDLAAEGGAGLPGSGDVAGNGNPPLPAGWSVKEH